MKNKKTIIGLVSVLAVVMLTAGSLQFMKGSVVSAEEAAFSNASLSVDTTFENIGSSTTCNPLALIDVITSGQLDSFGRNVTESEEAFNLTSENEAYLMTIYGILTGMDFSECDSSGFTNLQ